MHIHAFHVLTTGECSQFAWYYKLLLTYYASWWLWGSICEMNLQLLLLLVEIFQWNTFSIKKKKGKKKKKSPLPINQEGNAS